jgi:nitrogen fixation-related uncharacterized protein
MYPPTRKRKLLIQAGVAVLLLALGIAAIIWSVTRPFDEDDIKTEASSLRTYTSEGVLLAEHYRAGLLTKKFFETESYLLYDKAKTERESLDSAKPDRGAELELRNTRQLAAKTEAAMAKLNQNSQDLNVTHEELKDLDRQARDLTETLTK